MNRASALLGLLVLAGARAPAWAVTADATLNVRPYTGVPPAAINNLTVTPNAQEGQLRLDWTAPTVFPGTTLDSYQVRVQTISLTDVGGSTTTWWASSGGLLIQAFYSETSGQAVTRTLGPPGSDLTAGLIPGATYYLAVRSADDLGVPHDNWSGVGVTQVIPGIPLDTAPATPTGLSATASNFSIALSWTDLSAGQKGLDFDHYRIYRSTQSGTGFVQLATTTLTSYSDTAVSSGTVYFYRLTAIDRGVPNYPGQALESLPTAQVSAAPTGTPSIPPKVPNGLLSTPIANGLQAVLSWTPVTRDINGNAIAIDHYNVLRYNAIGSTATATLTVPGSASSYTDTTGGTLYFYRIQAVSSGGAPSSFSDYLDSAGNRYSIASDDIDTRVVMPNEAARYLLAANNSYGQDLEIVFTRQLADEVSVTLKSYRISARIVQTGQMLNTFAFPQNNISVELGYGSSLNAGRLPNGPSISGRAAGSIAQIVSVYWYNGAAFVSVGSPTLTSNQALSVVVRNLGIYQIRAVMLGTKFKMAPGSPYPRVITPNGAENRRVFFLFDNPADENITGEIFDIRGAHVRTLNRDSMSPTPNSLVWDGHDDRGAIVPSGVYLYKISTSDQSVTGTVVVAR